MSIHGYVGNIITANPTAPTSTVASGVWTTEQQLIARAAGNWPFTIPTQQISRSLRFNSADSAYLNRTPASTGSQTSWTWSGWVKRSVVTNSRDNVYAINNSNRISFSNDDSSQTLVFEVYNGGGADYYIITSAVYRDVSAWYHIVAVWDSNNATAGDRQRLYVNGVRITAFSSGNSIPSGATSNNWNGTAAHNIGRSPVTANYFNGYLTEIYFIDGQSLTPSSFGQTNASTGVWEPIAYAGTYGTNGFYVNFSDNSNTTAATLGKDYSGNGNNWTPNNFSVTAGAGNDSMVDSPTAYGTDTGVGGEVRGNYCTLNPLKNEMTLSNGNLAISGGLDTTTTATMAVPSTGKWYFEFVPTSMPASNANIGLASSSFDITNATFTYAEHRVYIQSGNKANGSGSVAYGASWTTSDVIGVAVDMDAGTLVFYKNNTSQGTAFSDLVSSGKTWFPLAANYGSGTFEGNFNFGQRAFAYTAPSGFKALVTTNLPTPTIGATSTTLANKYMDVTTYSGQNTSLTVTNSGSMQPDFVWIKSRNSTDYHNLVDAVRGTNKNLFSNTTDAEDTVARLTSFNSNGITLAGSYGYTNISGQNYVAWQWNAGGSTVTNTSGTISAQVRANTTSGFSIVTYTGTGSNATVGHGLGVAPQMVIVKKRSNAGNQWRVWHTTLLGTEYLTLSATDAKGTAAGIWNSTTPNSTVFSLGTDNDVNQSTHTFVAYCFAAVAGYSAFGSYTGNGSADGPFVYLGFRPRFILAKSSTTAATNWFICDTSRSPENVADEWLLPNGSNAEQSNVVFDILSNGFKLRNSAAEFNTSSSTYIYAAFAEAPFKYALAR